MAGHVQQPAGKVQHQCAHMSAASVHCQDFCAHAELEIERCVVLWQLCVLSPDLMACADLCIMRVGGDNFDCQDAEAKEGNGDGRGPQRVHQRAEKLAWVDKRVGYHCDHWEQFETAFIKHYVDMATHSANMTLDEDVPAPAASRTPGSSGGSGSREASKSRGTPGKGKGSCRGPVI